MITGASSIGTNNISRTIVNNGFSKIKVRLAAITTIAFTRTSPGNIIAQAVPTATLEKIAGKIVPPRHPITKPKLLITAFTSATTNRKVIE